MELRAYQKESVDLAIAAAREGKSPCVVLPTGAGKSLVQVELVREITKHGMNVLCLTHVKELIEQNYYEFLNIDHSIKSGIYSAGLHRRDTHCQVCFAGVQSIVTKIHEHHMYSAVIIDEAHLISPKAETRYQKVFALMRELCPKLIVIGMTATPFRLDQGYITDGKTAIFSDLIQAKGSTLPELIRDGFLSNIRAKAGSDKADLTGLKKSGGEYVAKEMQERFEGQELVEACVRDAIKYGSERKGWLFFAASVKIAFAITEELQNHSISCATIIGDTDKESRIGYIDAYKRQALRALVSVGVLTTGFNAKHVDLIILMRATESVALLIQMAGRGTRLFNGKKDCLVLDYGDNIARHGCLDNPDIYKATGDGEGEAPTKTCPECDEIVFAGCRQCEVCGFEFPPPEPKITKEAAARALLSSQQKETTSRIDKVFYSVHKNWSNKPNTLKVQYYYGMTLVVQEYVCLEHEGFAGKKARDWWRRRTGSDAPASVVEAFKLVNFLEQPRYIKWQQQGKFQKINEYVFTQGEML